ncbi:hypothetical protein PCANC_28136 [Puccinia coronata f. sp. avenae]|uniref:Uncharacterized protein n=1 Tax=Puccinia coronata f. sp. avenae TaxID=200324 RepID=A0A2N5S0G4_9BASI|nr:hypothetical protein PCANC_28136 [Puccinia coronata f. sp. avenae]
MLCTLRLFPPRPPLDKSRTTGSSSNYYKCLGARGLYRVTSPGCTAGINRSNTAVRGAAEGSKVSSTAGNNRSNTAVQAVLKQPCSTGGRTGTVQPKQEPTGRTDLSDRSRLVLSDRSQELIGQAFEHGCSSTARTAVFDRLLPAVLETLLPSAAPRSTCGGRYAHEAPKASAVLWRAGLGGSERCYLLVRLFGGNDELNLLLGIHLIQKPCESHLASRARMTMYHSALDLWANRNHLFDRLAADVISPI